MASRQRLVYTLRMDNRKRGDALRHHVKRQGIAERTRAAGWGPPPVTQLWRGYHAVSQRLLELELGVPRRG